MNNRKAVLEVAPLPVPQPTSMNVCSAMIAMGVPEHTAIFAATRNPAKSIGIYGEVGSLVPGNVRIWYLQMRS